MTINIDYTSRDFEGFKAALLDYAATAFPEWQPASEGDFGVLMVELLAYIGDVNSYYVDRAQREAYLSTASQPESILNIAGMLGYQPHNGQPATGTLTIRNTSSTAVTVPQGTQFATDVITEIDTQLIFETNAVLTVGANSVTSVEVTEGETKSDDSGNPIEVGTGDGTVEQQVSLPHKNVYNDTVRIFVEDEEWHEVRDILEAIPDERAFTVRTQPDGSTVVKFGDGLNGKVPANGLAIYSYYRVGYGSYGNISLDRITSLYKGSLSGIGPVASGAVASGGSDPETVEQVRVNAPRVFYTQNRAVTGTDYENLALSVAGVTKARAVAGHWSSVTVYLVGPDGNEPSGTVVNRVLTTLQSAALEGVSVSVSGPTLIPVNVGSVGTPVAVQVWPTYSNSTVQYNVEQAIKNELSFVNADLADRLTASQFYKAIMDVEGVRYVDVPLMARADAAQTGTADIQLQPWEFPTIGSLVVTTDGGLS